jgi:hypothetical protein
VVEIAGSEIMTREELVDKLRDALDDACDMDVTFGQYAEAVVRCLEKHGVFREWQAIKTAPRDGTRFLFWNGHHVCPGSFVSKKYFAAHGYPEGGIPDPTHWQPLPPPPEDI